MARAPVSVLVADNQPLTRLGISLALQGKGFDVVGEAAEALDAVRLIRRLRPQLCLLEVDLPGGGIEAARQVAGHCPESTVVMLTDSRESGHLFDSVRAGASGYLLKNIDPARLPLALLAVLDGEAALPRVLLAALMAEVRQSAPRADGPGWRGQLTPREWQVLDRLARDESTARIADELFVSSVTIRTHVCAILRKLDVSDRAGAVSAFRAQQ